MKDMHESEEYLPIEGFPDYLITSQGRVLSLKYGKMRELKPRIDRDGYLDVLLYKNGKQYRISIHQLVARAFIPNLENKPEVNHIDEDKTNNHVSNLEWMTHKENINHGTRNERVSKIMSDGRRKGSKHYRARAVIGFKINGCGIKYYKYTGECEKDGFNPVCIRNCCKGNQKQHKNFEWYYADEFFNGEDDIL